MHLYKSYFYQIMQTLPNQILQLNYLGEPVTEPPLNLQQIFLFQEHLQSNSQDPDRLIWLRTRLVQMHYNYLSIEEQVKLLQQALIQCKDSVQKGTGRVFIAPITKIIYQESAEAQKEQAEKLKSMLLSVHSKVKSVQFRESNIDKAISLLKKRTVINRSCRGKLRANLELIKQVCNNYQVIKSQQIKLYRFQKSSDLNKQYPKAQLFVKLWDSLYCRNQPMPLYFVPIQLQNRSYKIPKSYLSQLNKDLKNYHVQLAVLQITQNKSKTFAASPLFTPSQSLLTQLAQIRNLLYSKAMFNHLKSKFQVLPSFEMISPYYFQVKQQQVQLRVCIKHDLIENRNVQIKLKKSLQKLKDQPAQIMLKNLLYQFLSTNIKQSHEGRQDSFGQKLHYQFLKTKDDKWLKTKEDYIAILKDLKDS